MKEAQSLLCVGTSGYSYPWNESKPTPFAWYLSRGFNAVEVNGSFYRFPQPSWVRTWSKAPPYFTFSMKVHRSITHYSRLRGRATDLWMKFQAPLRAIDDRIRFYLFQMPPTYCFERERVKEIGSFLEATGLGNRAVFEFRHPSWWKAVEAVEGVGAAFCSIDCPDLPRDVLSVNDVAYLRLHGREAWYDYVYTEGELDDLLRRLKGLRAKTKAIFLNNDHGMLENGAYLLKKLSIR